MESVVLHIRHVYPCHPFAIIIKVENVVGIGKSKMHDITSIIIELSQILPP